MYIEYITDDALLKTTDDLKLKFQNEPFDKEHIN